MKKWNVAVLEDNRDLLKQLTLDLKASEQANVLIAESDSREFIKKVENDNRIDLLILDIELEGQNTDGIEVALILKKPVLFVSGKSVHFISQIEDINLDSDFPVDSIMKPATPDKLKKAIKKIGSEIEWLEKQFYVHIKIGDQIRKINQLSVVFIETISDGSNNKKIYFIDEKPTTLFNFSFAKMIEKGFNEDLFIKTHSSYRVNKNHVKNTNLLEKKLIVEFINDSAVLTNKTIPISDNYYSLVRKSILKK